MSSALILGCANCVWTDAEEAQKFFKPDAIFAVKDMIAKWPGRVDYGINLHTERTEGYLRERRLAGRNTNFDVWTNKINKSQEKHNIATDWAGSSGLFAVKVALQEKFEFIVLAGVPMQAQYRHIVRDKEWIDADCYYGGWKKRYPEMKDRVRSMSGWTKAQLGEPTQAWFNKSSSVNICHEMTA